MEQSLRKYVEDRSEGFNIKYKLVGYTVDTVTVAQMVDSLLEELPFIEDEKDSLEGFRKKRNWELELFERVVPNFEERMMRGDLKDATSYHTELREATEMADSLMEHWDDVTIYSWEYNYVLWRYYKKVFEDSRLDEYREASTATLDYIKNNKDKFDLLNGLLPDRDSGKVYRYVVHHRYSIFNPLFNTRVPMTDRVYFDEDMNYLGDDTEKLGI